LSSCNPEGVAQRWISEQTNARIGQRNLVGCWHEQCIVAITEHIRDASYGTSHYRGTRRHTLEECVGQPIDVARLIVHRRNTVDIGTRNQPSDIVA
jgi:hypothetical protein